MADSTARFDGVGATGSVLAINSGSSSIKFALFTLEPQPAPLCRGTLDEKQRPTAIEDVIGRLEKHLKEHPLGAVGHRVVHGGPSFHDPQVVTTELIEALRQLVRFAPNHLPDEITLIEAAGRRCPGTPQIVCFDTAFHARLPDVAGRLAIPGSPVAGDQHTG